MSAHSILPPSGAAAWRHCPMWVTMNQLYPQGDTPDTLAGNAAHWVFGEMLAGRAVTEGMQAPNGVYVTDEMIDGAELYVDTIRSRVPANVPLHVEEPVSIKRIHDQCWGTPDTWAFISTAMVLEVFDYKFGHEYVDEFENDQGVAYVAGLIEHLQLNDQILRVNFTIIQPRCYYRGQPVRTWSFIASDIRGNVNKLMNAAGEALLPNPRATTNPACGDCQGRHACQALQQAAYHDLEYSTQSAPLELPPEAASLELRMLERGLERLEARVDGLREAVATHIRQGKNVPHHVAEQGYGRQTWTISIDQVVAMGNLMGKDLTKNGVKTPKQAITAGVDEAVIKAYSITPLGKIKLLPNNTANAKKVFGSTY